MRPHPCLLSALSPSHCAVVEACAGSGKTWLLVSRMIRLLLAGAEPSELLAITFTRKAAEEMRERLDAWLQDLALLPDAEALAFLQQRGLSVEESLSALPRARGLMEAVLTAQPGPLITTFHGWFFHLLSHAPLSLRPPGEWLEHAALVRDEAWFDFLEALTRQAPADSPRQAFEDLAAGLSLASLRDVLDAFLAHRAEWWAWGRGLEDTCAHLAQALGVAEDDDVASAFFAAPGRQADLNAYQALVARNGARGLKRDLERGGGLTQVVEQLQDTPGGALDAAAAAHLLSILADLMLTREGTPLVVKAGPTLVGRLGADDAARYIDMHHALAEAVQQARQQQAEQRALRLNRQALTLGLAYVNAYQQLKAAQGVLDFTDAEQEVARLLADEASAAAVYLKLDARWKHLLLDEFQDTNPLQWGILRSWLEAYGQDGARPTVFLVGDPKQSIYRFRGAEPRLFNSAGAWLAQHFGAGHYPQNETRRCAPRVVAWLNALFSGRPDYPAFAPHTAHQATLPGWCEIHVQPPPPPAPDLAPPAEADDAPALRLPLLTPPPAPPPKRAEEAAWVAQRIRAVVGHLMIQDTPPRPARFSDITVLYAKRADLDVFEGAFRAAGIPYVTDRRGALLNALECQDMVALLTCLADPQDDLALAHALKSPVFGLQDAHLQTLTQASGPGWRNRLAAWAADPKAPAPVARAARLLARWQGQAGTLPVHDLLDQVYHQADVSAHYAQAVPTTLGPSVLANLEGFLALSLSLSGGRYPSLPRFLDELKQLRDKAGQEGPDEPPASAGERVRMLTIHSAKGLESAVVFLIKADDAGSKADHLGVMLDWPPEADRPRHFSLYGPKDWRGPGRDALLDEAKDLAAVERLNLLYVAMTRARQALFVSGVAPQKEKPDCWLTQLAAAHGRADLDPLPAMDWQAPTGHQADSPGPLQASPPAPPPPLPPIGTRRDPDTPETRFGTRLHAWLEHRTEGRSPEDIQALWAEDPAYTLEQAADGTVRLHALAERILAIPELTPAFQPGAYLNAFNELEFLDESGRSARMDRLVEFSDHVWVLDYKSGGLADPDLARRARPHADQMARYQRAAQAMYPNKPVRAALVFADGQVFWCPPS